jgi:hypothetical protein
MISPEALSVAKQHLSGVPNNQLLAAMGNALQAAPNVPLVQLMAAHKMLAQEQQKQQAMQAMQMAQQGGGVAPQQPTTVAQDTQQGLAQLAMQDQQPPMQDQQQPMAQEPTMQAAHGGLMQLPVHNFRPEHYAGGGIVAFGDPELNPNENQVVSTETGDKYTRFPSSTNERQLVYPSMLDRLFNRDAMKTYNDMLSRRKGQTTSKDLAAQNIGQSTTTPEALVTEPATISSETGTRYTPLSEVPPGLATEPVEQGLGATPEGRARTDQTRRPAVTPAAATATASAASETTEPKVTPAMQAIIDRGNKTRGTLESYLAERTENLTPEEAQTRAEKQNTEALKKAGVKSYKDRIDEFKGLATQAREDRNTDRWLAVAQGFFAMGAGKSRYAMQNMAEGLGVGVGQLKEAEKEHRKAEQANKDRINLLEEAHRQEVLGNVKAGRELYKDAEQRKADERKNRIAVLGHLAGSDDAQLARLQAAQSDLEGRKFTARENRLGRESVAGSQAAATAAYKDAALAEQKRQHDIQDAAARRTLYARATEKHPGYKTLQELQQSIADMQSRPDLTIDQQKNLQAKITQHNALQAAIHTAAQATAQREFGAGNSGWSDVRQGQ